jgi:hypothetical protein
MKKEIILIIVVVLAIIGLAYKNKQIDRLEKRQKEILTELSDYKWKYEHLEYVCNKEDENGNDN